MSLRAMAEAARAGGRVLQGLPSQTRVAAMHRVADALVANADAILQANQRDIDAVRAAVASGDMSSALAARLPLSTAKLHTLAQGIRAIANAEEPLGQVVEARELAPGLVLRKETAPLGALLVIFESRPDALPQIAALALRSGNALVLKGGREAQHSNTILHRVIVDALAPDIPAETIALVHTREDIASLLHLDDVIDLVIPRGSNALVRHIQANTRIPVLGHADGICHVYVDASADASMAHRIVLDSKTDYPAACNAMETLLVHADVWDTLGHSLVAALQAAGVTVFAGPGAQELGLQPAVSLAHEYGDMACAVAVVSHLDKAIEHIHTFGSGHTDAIVSNDEAALARFRDGVDSACVFVNASTRFADGFRFGLGAEVGISTSRIHARGPVGVRGLLTTRYKLSGSGDIVGPFSSGERQFTHKRL